MKIVQLQKKLNEEWTYLGAQQNLHAPLVLVFGNRFELQKESVYSDIKGIFKDGHIVFGSTSGNITAHSVEDESIAITAIEFEKSSFSIKTTNVLNIEKPRDSYTIGRELIEQFPKAHLKHVFILSEGSFVNGSQLTQGMNAAKGDNVTISGALCGDGSRFEKTLASYNENPKKGEVVAIGLYGESLEVSSAIDGGWTPFGPERIVTKSMDNVLYELDNQPALDLYKKYLGDKSVTLSSTIISVKSKICQ